MRRTVAAPAIAAFGCLFLTIASGCHASESFRSQLDRLSKSRQEKGAAKLCQDFLNSRPSSKDTTSLIAAHIYLAGYFQRKQRDSEAIAQVDEAIKLAPNNANLYYARGVTKFESHKIEDSIADFEQAKKLGDPPEYSDRMLGSVYGALGDTAKSLSYFDAALKRFPKTHEFYPQCVFFRAKELATLKQYDKAIADYSKLVDLKYNSSEVRAGRAQCYIELKQFKAALDDYNTLLKAEPANDDLHRLRGDLQMKMGDAKAALDDLTMAVKINPSPRNYRARAAAYEMSGMPEQAKADRKTAERLR